VVVPDVAAASSSVSAPVGALAHLVVSVDGAGMASVFRDGQLAATAALGILSTSPGELLAGVPGSRVDEVAVYDAELSSARVRAHFLAGAGIDPTCIATAASTDAYGLALLAESPMGWWRLDEPAGPDGSARVGRDSSGECVDATLGVGSAPTPGPAGVGASTGMESGVSPIGLSATDIDLPSSVEARSIEAWVRGIPGSFGRVLESSGLSLSLGADGTTVGSPVPFTATNTTTAVADSSTLGLLDGDWHLVSIGFDAVLGVVSLWVDGTQRWAGPVTLPTLLPADGPGTVAMGVLALDEVAVFAAPPDETAIGSRFGLATDRSVSGADCVDAASDRYSDEVLVDDPLRFYRLSDRSMPGEPVARDVAPGSGCVNGLYGRGARSVFGAAEGSNNTGVRVGASTALVAPGTGLPSGSTDRSLELWLRPGPNGLFGVGFAEQGERWLAGYGDFGFAATSERGSVRVRWGTGDRFADVTIGAASAFGRLANPEWVHLVAAVDDGVVSVMVNGAVAWSSGEPVMVATAVSDLVVGAPAASGFSPDPVSVDDIAIYGEALSAERAKAHWVRARSNAESVCPTEPSSGHPQRLIDDGAVALFRLDELASDPDGSVAFDSVDCRHGSYGAPALAPATNTAGNQSAPGAFAGDPNTAARREFDQANWMLEQPMVMVPLAGLPTGSQPRSFEFWAQPAGVGVAVSLADQMVAFFDPSGTQQMVPPGATPAVIPDFTGRWHHFVATVAPGPNGVLRYQLWVNGTRLVDTDLPMPSFSEDWGYLSVLTGQVDELAIYDRVLTDEVIAAHHALASQIDTTTTLTAPQVWLESTPFTVTANVARTIPLNGATLPAGTVTLRDRGQMIAGVDPATVLNGVAELEVSLGPGAHSLVASFEPTVSTGTDPPFAGSRSAALERTIAGDVEPSVAVAVTPAVSDYGTTATAAVTVAPPEGVAGPVTGEVVVRVDGGSPRRGTLSNGAVDIALPKADPGIRTVTATFEGSTVFQRATATSGWAVAKLNPDVRAINETDSGVVRVSVAEVQEALSGGGFVQIPFGVARPAGAPSNPLGRMVLKIDGAQVAVSPLWSFSMMADGTAAWMNVPAHLLTLGEHALVAEYSGDARYRPAGWAGELVVEKTRPWTTTSFVPMLTAGSTTDVRAYVSTPHSGPPEGTVTFTATGPGGFQAVSEPKPVSGWNGAVWGIPTDWPIGVYDIRAVFNGNDTVDVSPPSPPSQLRIGVWPAIHLDDTVAWNGQVTGRVDPDPNAPGDIGGTVTLFSGFDSISAPSNVNPDGTFTLTIDPTVEAGERAVLVNYTGDLYRFPALATNQTLTVNPVASAVGLTATTNNGETTLVATVDRNGPAPRAGGATVTFRDVTDPDEPDALKAVTVAPDAPALMEVTAVVGSRPGQRRFDVVVEGDRFYANGTAEIEHDSLTTTGTCSAGASDRYSNTVQADNPLRYYRLDRSAGPEAADTASPTGGCANGVFTSASTPTAGALETLPDGAVASAGSVLSVPGTGLPVGDDDRSVEVWVRASADGTFTNGTGERVLVAYANNTFGIFAVPQRGMLRFRWGPGDQYRDVEVTPSTALGPTAARQWIHLVLSLDAATPTVYIAGRLAWRADEPVDPATLTEPVGQLRVGSGPSAGANVVSFDELAIYGRALSAAEVREHRVRGESLALQVCPTRPNSTHWSMLRADGAAAVFRFDEPGLEPNPRIAHDAVGCIHGTYAPTVGSLSTDPVAGALVGDPSSGFSRDVDLADPVGETPGVMIPLDRLPTGDQDRTVEFWAQPAASGLVAWYGTQPLLMLGSAGEAMQPGNPIQPAVPATIASGWRHFAFVFRHNGQNHEWVVYIDGIEQGVNPDVASVFGTSQSANAAGFLMLMRGQFDELAVYPYQLPATQIAAHHANGLAPDARITVTAPGGWASGAPTALAVKVEPQIAGGSVPVGTVQVANVMAWPQEVSAPATLDSNGEATVTYTTTSGVNPLVAAYSPAANHEGLTYARGFSDLTALLDVEGVAPTVTAELTDGRTTFEYGEPFAAEATVAGGNPLPLPTGAVGVTLNGLNVGGDMIADGHVRFVVPHLEPGRHTVRFDYVGDDTYAQAHTEITFEISKRDTRIHLPVISDGVALTELANPSSPIEIWPAVPGGSNPTGQVTVQVGDRPARIVQIWDFPFMEPDHSVVGLDWGITATGDYPLTITYGGDARHRPSTWTGTLRVATIDRDYRFPLTAGMALWSDGRPGGELLTALPVDQTTVGFAYLVASPGPRPPGGSASLRVDGSAPAPTVEWVPPDVSTEMLDWWRCSDIPGQTFCDEFGISNDSWVRLLVMQLPPQAEGTHTFTVEFDPTDGSPTVSTTMSRVFATAPTMAVTGVPTRADAGTEVVFSAEVAHPSGAVTGLVDRSADPLTMFPLVSGQAEVRFEASGDGAPFRVRYHGSATVPIAESAPIGVDVDRAETAVELRPSIAVADRESTVCAGLEEVAQTWVGSIDDHTVSFFESGSLAPIATVRQHTWARNPNTWDWVAVYCARITFDGAGPREIVVRSSGDDWRLGGVSQPATLDVSANPDVTVSVAANQSNVEVGTAIDLDVTVSPDEPAFADAPVPGEVDLLIDDQLVHTETWNNPATDTNTFRYTTTFTSPGIHDIRAEFRSHVLSDGTAETTVTATGAGWGIGSPVTISVDSPAGRVSGQAVSGAVAALDPADTRVPTGDTSLRIDGQPTTSTVALDSSGRFNAADVTRFLPPGDYTLRVRYNGDPNFAPTTQLLGLTIASRAAVDLHSSTTDPLSVSIGESLLIEAVVATVAPGSGAPSGDVEFRIGDGPIARAGLIAAPAPFDDVAAAATVALAFDTPGRHTVYLDYRGGPAHESATTTMLVDVALPTQVELTLSPAGTTTLGEPVQAVAAVTSSGVTVSGGTVSFYAGDTLLGTEPVSSAGVASRAITLPAGQHAIRVEFAPDDTLAYARSNATADLTVEPPITVGLVAEPRPTIGATTTLTASVSNGSAPLNTGSVQFFAASTPLGAGPMPLDSAGAARLAWTPPTAGPFALRVEYTRPGAQSPAAIGTLTAMVSDATVTVNEISRPTAAPATLSVTANVRSLTNTAGSAALVRAGDNQILATASVTAPDSSITLAAPNLGPGAQSFRVEFTSTNGVVSQSSQFTWAPGQLRTDTNASSFEHLTIGRAHFVNFAVSAWGSGAPLAQSGTAQLFIDGIPTGPASPVNHTWTDNGGGSFSYPSLTLPLPGLARGPHTIRVAYSGSTNLAPSFDEFTVTAGDGVVITRDPFPEGVTYRYGDPFTWSGRATPADPSVAGPVTGGMDGCTPFDTEGRFTCQRVLRLGMTHHSPTRLEIRPFYRGNAAFGFQNAFDPWGDFAHVDLERVDTTTHLKLVPGAGGAPPRLVATVDASTERGGPVVGEVEFMVDGSPIGRAVLTPVGWYSRLASATLTYTPPAGATVVARYVGDLYWNPSDSTQHVNQLVPTVDTVVSKSVAAAGEEVSVTVTLSGDSGPPTGVVTLFRDEARMAEIDQRALVNGQATFPTPVTGDPFDQIEFWISYSGDSNYLQEHDRSFTTIGGRPQLTLSVSPEPSDFGESVVPTATLDPWVGMIRRDVSANQRVYTGTIDYFLEDPATGAQPVRSAAVKAVPGTFPIRTSAVADPVEPIIFTTAGPHTIWARARPDGGFFESLPASVVHYVGDVGPGSLAVAPVDPQAGDVVSVRATVNSAVPDGSVVTFSRTGPEDGATPVVVGPAGGAAVGSLPGGDRGVELSAISLPVDSVGTNLFQATVSGPGFASFTLNTSVTVRKRTTEVQLVQEPSVLRFGAPGAVTATVLSGSGLLRPANSVSFTVDGVAASPVPLVDGVASLSTEGWPAGTFAVTARYLGDDLHEESPTSAPAMVTVERAATELVLQAPASVVASRNVDLVATLRNTSANTTVTAGSVDFFEVSTTGLVSLGSADIAMGAARLPVALPDGSHTIVARFTETDDLVGSTSLQRSILVAPARTATRIAVSPNPAPVGSPQVVTVTVGSEAGTPTGSVILTLGSQTLVPEPLSGGVARVTIVPPPGATTPLVATFSSDSVQWEGSSATTSVVARHPTSTSVSAPAVAVVVGENLPVTATVSPPPGVLDRPAGPVSIEVDDRSASTANLPETGALSIQRDVSFDRTGTFTVGAAYGGDGQFDGSEVPAAEHLSVTVAKAGTTTELGAVPAIGTIGQPASVTATVRSVAPSVGVPRGSVQFYRGESPVGSPTELVNGVATYRFTPTTAMDDAFYAEFVESPTHLGSESPPVTWQARPTVTLTVATDPTAPVAGRTTTIIVTAFDLGGFEFVSGGAATLFLDGATTGVAMTPVPLGWRYDAGPLPLGTHRAEVTFDHPDYVPTTATTSLRVEKAAASVTATVAAPLVHLQPFDVRVQVAAQDGIHPTGNVTIELPDGTRRTRPLGIVDEVPGVAVVPVPGLPAGQRDLHVTYAGSSVYLGTDTTIQVEVAAAGTSLVVAPRQGPVPPGTPVIFDVTAEATAPGGGVPAGELVLLAGTTELNRAPLIDGTATLAATVATTEPIGPWQLTVGYRGTGEFHLDTDANVVQDIRPAGVWNITMPLEPVVVGDIASFAVEIGGAVTPGGRVSLRDGETLLAAASLDASGPTTLTTTGLRAGSRTLTFAYDGDPGVSSGQATRTIEVGPRAPAITIASTHSPASVNQDVILTARIPAGSQIAPTGTITFRDGNAVIGTAEFNEAGVAALTKRWSAPAAMSITATYDGDSNYLDQTTEPMPLEVNPGIDAAIDATVESGTAPVEVHFDGRRTTGAVASWAWSFGDGTTSTSSNPSHTFTTPGVYAVTLKATTGTQFDIASKTITVGRPDPVLADGGDNRTVNKGQPVSFDGTNSAPRVGMERYDWEFGDGATASGPAPEHTYTRTGTFTAKLTVTSGTQRSTDTFTVRVVAVEPARRVAITVTSGPAASPLAGATVLLVDQIGGRYERITDNAGVARVDGLADHRYSAYAYKQGFRPARVEITVVDGVATASVNLMPGGITSSTIERRDLNPAEAADFGVDLDDPANYNLQLVTIELGFGERITVLPGGWGSSSGGTTKWRRSGPGCGDCSPSGGVSVEETVVAGQRIITIMTVSATVGWLKDIYQIDMAVVNLADEGFALTHPAAMLELPPGLSLPLLDSQPQSAAQSMAVIDSGETATATWLVRADRAGAFDLNGSFAASLYPFGDSVRITSSMAASITSTGAEALQLDVSADDQIHSMSPYRMTATLRNVSDSPVYNLFVAWAPAGENQVLVPKQRTKWVFASIPPGGSERMDVMVFPLGNGAGALNTDTSSIQGEWLSGIAGGDGITGIVTQQRSPDAGKFLCTRPSLVPAIEDPCVTQAITDAHTDTFMDPILGVFDLPTSQDSLIQAALADDQGSWVTADPGLSSFIVAPRGASLFAYCNDIEVPGWLATIQDWLSARLPGANLQTYFERRCNLASLRDDPTTYLRDFEYEAEAAIGTILDTPMRLHARKTGYSAAHFLFCQYIERSELLAGGWDNGAKLCDDLNKPNAPDTVDVWWDISTGPVELFMSTPQPASAEAVAQAQREAVAAQQAATAAGAPAQVPPSLSRWFASAEDTVWEPKLVSGSGFVSLALPADTSSLISAVPVGAQEPEHNAAATYADKMASGLGLDMQSSCANRVAYLKVRQLDSNATGFTIRSAAPEDTTDPHPMTFDLTGSTFMEYDPDVLISATGWKYYWAESGDPDTSLRWLQLEYQVIRPGVSTEASPWIPYRWVTTCGDDNHEATWRTPNFTNGAECLKSVTEPAGSANAKVSVPCRVDPINTYTGNLIAAEVDARIPALGTALDIGRTYNSSDPRVGMFGRGWSSRFEVQLVPPAIGGEPIRYIAADGQQLLFMLDTSDPDPAPTYRTPGSNMRLRREVTGLFGYTLLLSDMTQLSFDETGRLLRIEDRNGFGVDLGYLGNRLQTVTDPVGRTVRFEPAPNGLVGRIVLPNGGTLGYEYQGDLLRVVTGLNATTTRYEYNPAGLMSDKFNGANERVHHTEYDSDGRAVSQIDALGGLTTFEWNPATETSVMTDPRGGRWVDRFRDGQLISERDPTGKSMSYAYHSTGQIAMITNDVTGAVETRSYDDRQNMTRSTRDDGTFVELAYDSFNNVTSSRDRRGFVTRFGYDNLGRVTSHTDPDGRETTMGTNFFGLVDSITDAEGRESTFAHDGAGNVTASCDPTDRCETATFDVFGRPLTQTTPWLATTQYSYDDLARTVTVRDPLLKSTVSRFDLAGREDLITDPTGVAVATSYWPGGLVKTTGVVGATPTQSFYDPSGNLTRLVDPTGRTTRFGFDGAGRPTWTLTATGETWNTVYDLAGRPTRDIDPLGNETVRTFDRYDRLHTVTDAEGGVTRYTYDANGNVATMVDALERTTVFTYDRLNRRTQIDGPAGVAKTAYHTSGSVKRSESPAGDVVTYDYDDSGRLTKTVEPRGNAPGASPDDFKSTAIYDDSARTVTTVDAAGRPTVQHFDLAGRLTQLVEPSGLTTSYGFDDAGRITSVTADATGAQPATTSYGYDNRGDLRTITDPRTNQTTYTYDDAGRVRITTNPAGGVSETLYDDNGQIAATLDPNGHANGGGPEQWVSYRYDPRGLLDTIDYGDPNTSDVSFGYDRAGRRTSMSDGDGVEIIEPDALGRTTSVIRNGARFTYEYGPRGGLTSRLYPDGTFVGLPEDSAGRTGAIVVDDIATHLDYLPGGLLERIDRTLGASESFGYDRLGRLESWQVGPGGSVASQVRGFDVAGNPELDTRNNNQSTLGYDDRNRITSDSSSPDGSGGTTPEVFSFDASGNRAPTGSMPPGLTYDERDQLTDPTAGRQYDANGQLVADGVFEYRWDQAGRLVEVSQVAENPAAPSPGAARSAAIVADNPTDHWSFDQPSAPGVWSSSGTTSLAPVGANPPGRIATGAVTPDDGAAQGAGTCCGLAVSDPDAGLSLGGDGFTVEWWQQRPSVTSSGTVLEYDDTAEPHGAPVWQVVSGSDGRLVFSTDDGWELVTDPQAWAPGWQHVAFVADATTARWVVDGVTVASSTSAPPAARPLPEGGVLSVLPSATVSIDELAIYDSGLATARLAAHHAAAATGGYGLAVGADSPVGLWRLGDVSTGVIADASGNGRPGVPAGSTGPSQVAGWPTLGTGVGAVSFDGLADGVRSDVMSSRWNLDGAGTGSTLEFSFRSPLGHAAASGASVQVMAKGRACAGCGGWRLRAFADGSLEYRRDGVNYRSNPGVVDAGWSHVALTVTSSTLSWFVDGQPAGVNTLPAGGFPTGTGANLTIGRRSTGGPLVERFAVDDVAFFDRVIPGGHHTDPTPPTATTTSGLGVGGTVTYRYDGAGRRVAKTVNGATTRYRWDTQMAVPDVVEIDAPDGSHTTTVYGPSGPLQTRTSTPSSEGDWEYLHQDAVGSTVAVTDATGAVIGERRYSVFGDRWNQTGVMAPAAQRFATATWEPDTGLWFLKARYLDPHTAMFLSRDPIPIPIGDPHQSPYTYVWGMPTRLIDPTGMLPENPAEQLDEAVHMALDTIGMLPVIGEIADVINAVWYLTEGRWSDAAFSAIAIIPLVGTVTSAARRLAKGVDLIADVADTTRVVGKVIDGEHVYEQLRLFEHVGEAVTDTARALDNGADLTQDANRAYEQLRLFDHIENATGARKATEGARASRRGISTGDHSFDDLGPLGPNLEGLHGVTDGRTGNIRINSRLPAAEAERTLRHELVHQRIVRGPLSGPVSRGLYDRSAAWTFGEEALAEYAGTGSLRAALAHPAANGYIRPGMVAFDAAVLGVAGGGAYGIYEASE